MREGWGHHKIDEFCLVTDYVANGSFASLKENVQYLDQLDFAMLIRYTDHANGWNGRHKYVSESAYKFLRKSSLKPGDLIMANVGDPGNAFLLPNLGMPTTLGPNSILIRAEKEITSNEFLHYFFLSLEGRQLIDEISAGAAQRKFNKTSFRGLTIPLPPLEEQQRIVAVLDEAFEGLARARAHAEANLQNARELFESYLFTVFSEGNWPEKTLNQISENLDRVRVPITKSNRVAGDIPYYGASGVVDHVADFLFDEDLLLISEDGANLLARTYPIAFSISGKAWVNNHAHVLRFPDLDTQEFVRLYLNSISLEPYVSGMAQPKLNQAQLNRIPIPFPDSADRTEIVAKAELLAAETEDLQRRFEATLQDLDDLRQSLLQTAFAGELT